MMRKNFITRLFMPMLLQLLAVRCAETESSISASENKQRGVCWVAGGEITEDDLKPLIENHVNWISQTPFGWQQDYNSPEFAMATDGRVLWGERDQGLVLTTQMAKKHGIKTLLKPHIWLRNRRDGKWLSDIAMDNEADWQIWFAHYQTFIMHYAELAEKNGIEAFVCRCGASCGDQIAARRLAQDYRRSAQSLSWSINLCGQLVYLEMVSKFWPRISPRKRSLYATNQTGREGDGEVVWESRWVIECVTQHSCCAVCQRNHKWRVGQNQAQQNVGP